MFALYMLFGGPTELFGDTKKDIEKKNYKLEKFGDVVSFSYSNVMYDKNWIEIDISEIVQSPSENYYRLMFFS